VARILHRLAPRLETLWATLLGRTPLAIFHHFHRPPFGGGNQFLLALRAELRRRGIPMVANTITARTPACLFNSFNFDFDDLRSQRRPGCRMVHRMDGPIDVYRGTADGHDARIHALNLELADATVFQSRYSLDRHRELGMEFRAPVVIPNAVDPSIFHPDGRGPADPGGKVRLIATSWSDNPRKGGPTFEWLDAHLDWKRYSMTFVGRTRHRFANIRHVPPLASAPLARLLRSHDIYIAASQDDPCSNALLEALACGLPAAYLRSGGHPELVGEAGLPFDTAEELPSQLERLAASHAMYQRRIAVPPIEATASAYLAMCGVTALP
jgi:glycosyltransferase involved in cell wall biosynthesis